MSDNLTFNFPFPLLLQEADTIVHAAETHSSELALRLPAGFASATRPLIKQASDQDAAAKIQAANVGELTTSQQNIFADLNRLLGNLRDTAKKAFKGSDVKLHDEFQVGINKPADLASVLQRARIMLTAARQTTNANALQAKGWIPTDSDSLDDTIDALDTTDNDQEAAKTDATGGTNTRNRTANDLYARLQTIQNAANLQWPEKPSTNAPIRAQFRLGHFPPRGGSSPTTPPTPPTPPTPHP
jgi:hypothetical protein